MITEKSRLMTRLETCLSLDKDEPTSLRVQVDKIVMYLHEFKIFVPPRQFEEAVKIFLKEKVMNKVPLGNPGTFPAIANAIYTLAETIVDKAASEQIIDSLEAKDKLIDEEVAKYLKEKGSRK